MIHTDLSLQIQDPFVLMDPAALGEVLWEWLQVLERVLCVEEPGSTGEDEPLKEARPREERLKPQSLEQQQPPLCSSSGEPIGHEAGKQPPLSEKEHQGEGVAPESTEEEEEEVVEVEEVNAGEREERCHGTPEPGGGEATGGAPVRTEPVRTQPPTPLPSDLLGDLTPLATLYLELSCFRGQGEEPGSLGVAGFLRRYFFLLDVERVRRMCLLCHKERPEMQSSFIEAMQGEGESPELVAQRLMDRTER